MTPSFSSRPQGEVSGKLRIGDHWNAINIIALSQSNPLKAVAELVENSIDARATQVTIVRGRQRGKSYLRLVDNGKGIPLDDDGLPNFKYVATHICDSLKRQMKAQGEKGVQGEFGIGLLSFWTVGETLSLVSSGSDGKSYEMRMAKGDPTYTVTRLRRLVDEAGVQLTISPLLPGIRHFSGEKLQWYLASELRDRIRQSGVAISIVDRTARSQFKVEPRAFTGQLLHHLPCPSTPFGDVYVELYLTDGSAENRVGLYRSGTRVLESMTNLDGLQRSPWTSSAIQGVIDAPFLNLTPGSRLGVIQDERFNAFLEGLGTLEETLTEIIRQQEQAELEQANRDTLRSIQRAFREALLTLPEEEYDWFDAYGADGRKKRTRPGDAGAPLPVAAEAAAAGDQEAAGQENDAHAQREFFDHAGPLYSVKISPSACTLSVGKTRTLRAVARDRRGRQVESDLVFHWQIVEGEAELTGASEEIVTLTAPAEPQLLKLTVTATQDDCTAEGTALVTVTDSLLPESPKADARKGLPAYTFEKQPGQLWRSRYDASQNLIAINSGHRDFAYAARTKTLKLRYICRLFAKELVLHNFPGYSADQLLERMIELSLYTEDNLR